MKNKNPKNPKNPTKKTKGTTFFLSKMYILMTLLFIRKNQKKTYPKPMPSILPNVISLQYGTVICNSIKSTNISSNLLFA